MKEYDYNDYFEYVGAVVDGLLMEQLSNQIEKLNNIVIGMEEDKVIGMVKEVNGIMEQICEPEEVFGGNRYHVMSDGEDNELRLMIIYGKLHNADYEPPGMTTDEDCNPPPFTPLP